MTEQLSNNKSLIISMWYESRLVVPNALQPQGLYSPWNSPGQNTGVGCHAPIQGIFPTQGSIPGLLYCRWILYQLSHKGSPRILEWVAYPFSRESSWPGIKPRSPTLQADSLPTEPQGKPYYFYRVKKLSGTISLEKAERRISHVNKSMQMKFKFASALSVVSQRLDNTYRGHWGSLFR